MTRTERRERQRRRKLQIARRVVSALLALVLILVCILLLTGGGKADTPEAEAAVTGPAAMPEPQRPEQEAVDPLEADKIALAKMVWGEARGCSTTEQAATIWCVLNRYDSGDRFWADTVEGSPASSTATTPATRWTRTFWPWWRMCWPAGWPRRIAWAAWAGCCRGNICTSPATAYTTTSPRNGEAGRPGTGPWKARMRSDEL